MSEVSNQIQEQQVKKLKRLLEGWRMALLPLKSVFLWEQQWHPAVIVAATSIFYLIMWLMDLNLLTSVAVVCLFINFLDFLVPIACSSICNPNSWNGQKEKHFEDTCKSLVGCYNGVIYKINNYCSLRETSPMTYYIITIGMLCVMAFIGSTINNTFLLYLLTTIILLLPGLQNKGLCKCVLSKFMRPQTLKSE